MEYKKIAGTNDPIRIGKQISKMKKGPESGIPRNSSGIPPDFPTKVARMGRGGLLIP